MFKRFRRGYVQLLKTPSERAERVDYLVGGLRISLGDASTTPGPRSHILGFVEGLRQAGLPVRVLLASGFPGLRRFASIGEGRAASRSAFRLAASDAVRLLAMLWSGALTFLITSRSGPPKLIYERAAVFQYMSLFHRWRRRSVRVVESNGIMSIETAADRNALAFPAVAAWVERRLYRSADIVVVVSDALADEVERFAGVPRVRILVVPNAVPYALGESVRVSGQHRAGGGGLVVGFVGSVVPWQQLDLLLTATAQIERLSAGPSLRVEIIGDGPQLQDLKEQARALGIDSLVVFHGGLPQPEAFERMRNWNVGYSGHKGTVGKSMYHSPLKLYEYAGLGLGAIATPSADLEALKSDGMPVWSFTDPESLATALLEAKAAHVVLREYRDGDDAARVAEKNSWGARAEMVLRAIARSQGPEPQEAEFV